MLTQDAVQKILGIEEKVQITKEEIADKFNVTFFPYSKKVSKDVREFEQKLKESFKRLKVNIVPYEDAWIPVPLFKRIRRFLKYSINDIIWIFRKAFGMTEINFYLSLETLLVLAGSKRIKRGISVVCSGEQELDTLQMQYIANFKDNSIINIVDFPKQINEFSTFENHFDTAMGLFAYHMANIILAVDKDKMMVYNFNASHPIYFLDDGKFDLHILETLIPKVVAPISPHRFEEFIINKTKFDPEEVIHKKVITELKDGAKAFAETKLYPSGKKIDDLPFRHNFHKLIGKLHLDNRSGMSFGFLAYQMPSPIIPITLLQDFKNKDSFFEKDYIIDGYGNIFIVLRILEQDLVMQIPEIWVMTLRSGSDKTNFDQYKDLIKLGLKNGHMYMEFPKNLDITSEYKPSFDTKVILTHAIGNVIIASVLDYFQSNSYFSRSLANSGMGISHWHGYFNRNHLPEGLSMYGIDNPHVSCSSPQSAIYALRGKLSSFSKYMKTKNNIEYKGDIHIEPHHGINVTYPSLVDLADYILKNPSSTELGNKYLHY